MAPIDPAVLVQTRLDLHAVAEHVLMADLHHHTGRIGLRGSPGGFATPVYETRAGARRLRVEHTEVVAELDGAPVGRAALTTLGEIREALGIEARTPTDLYPLATDADAGRALRVDREVADLVATVFAATDTALGTLRAEAAAEREGGDAGLPTAQLWPEHFDLAVTIDEVNYGGSPGDAEHEEPYLYVGPHALPPPDGTLWNEPFGTSRPALPPPTGIEALEFFRAGRAALSP